MAKRKKSKKNKNAFGKILLLIILVGIIGVVVYFGYDNYIEVQKEYDNLEEVMVRTDDLVDKVISSDINLSSLITDDSAVVASWTSSNSKYLTSEGRVTRPTYTEGDKVVTLTVTYTLSFKDKITQIVYNFVKQEEKTASYVIRVLASEATDSEKTALALESLNVPEAIYDNIELPTSYPLFESVTITWKNNEQDIENTSEVSGEEITLIATATSNNISKSETFKVQVKNEQLTITTVAQDFNDVSVSSRYNSFKDKGVDFTNARVFEYTTSEETDESETGDYSDRYIRLRTEGEALSGFVTPAIANFSNMSFSYIYAGTQTGLESSFKISASVDNQKTFIVIDEVTILHVEEKTKIEITGDNLKSKGIDLTKTVIIKVEHTTTFASCYVDIDDIVITRDVNKNDFIEAVISEIPTSSNKYFNLPFTTKYGGNITYESSNTDIVTSSGVVKTVPEISTTVNLTGTISFNGEEYTFTVELKITGTTVSAPIEIYFFDIGKYGTSDCGESIYIKFGSIDILVDAGDNFTASKQAIEEGINAHLDDGILDYVIATHPDADHIGGMTNVFEKYQVENLIVFDGEHTSQKYRNFKEAYEKEECNVLNIYDDIISKK